MWDGQLHKDVQPAKHNLGRSVRNWSSSRTSCCCLKSAFLNAVGVKLANKQQPTLAPFHLRVTDLQMTLAPPTAVLPWQALHLLQLSHHFEAKQSATTSSIMVVPPASLSQSYRLICRFRSRPVISGLTLSCACLVCLSDSLHLSAATPTHVPATV